MSIQEQEQAMREYHSLMANAVDDTCLPVNCQHPLDFVKDDVCHKCGTILVRGDQ